MDRLKELVTILESSGVADGAQIKLRNDKAFSPLRRAVESKTSSPDLASDKNAKLLNDMAKLLGGGLG